MIEIEVTVNGEGRRFPADWTVGALLAGLGLDPSLVAVERNHCVVPRRIYESTRLASGDAIEIVTFVGGG
jgi:thiamine biosynthesis protein ThiS